MSATAENKPHDLPPNYGQPINQPKSLDVLSGRGGRIAQHPGNIFFRQLIRQHRPIYISKETKKADKAKIAAKIVKTIRDMGGRFLKEIEDRKVDNNEEYSIVWVEIGDLRARKKTGQAMREKLSIESKQRKTSSKPHINNLEASTISLGFGQSCDSARLQHQHESTRKRKKRSGPIRSQIESLSKPNALPDSLIQDCISEILPSDGMDQTQAATFHHGASHLDSYNAVDESSEDTVDPLLLSEIESSLDESLASIDQIGHGDDLCDQIREESLSSNHQPKKRRCISGSDSFKRPKARQQQQADLRRKQFHMMKFESSTLPSFPQPTMTTGFDWFSSLLFQR